MYSQILQYFRFSSFFLIFPCLLIKKIGEKDWNVVFEECSPLASRWQQLSAYLGLQLSIIDRIKSDFPKDCLGCWSEALKEWIKMNYDIQRYSKPSWKTLLRAIAKIDKLNFRRLATEHQVTGIYHKGEKQVAKVPTAGNLTL